MAMPYGIDRLVDAPLEDVLLKLCPATVLKWLHEAALRQVVENHPAAFAPPAPSPARPAKRDKAPAKLLLIPLFLRVLRDKELGRQFFAALPPPSRDLLAVVTWQRRVNLASLEQTLGREIATPNPDLRRVYYEPFLLPPEYGLLVIAPSRASRWDYRPPGENPRKQDYDALLPTAVRKAFQTFVPPPAEFDLVPLEQVPDTGLRHYSCAQKAVADLRLVAEYIAHGHLKYTKSERVVLPSLKSLRQMTGGPEFFPEAETQDLVLPRTRLLVGGTAFAGEKERAALLAGADLANPTRLLCEKVLANASFLHEELLGHLAGTRNDWCPHNPLSVRKLAKFFGTFPAGKWVSWENLRAYHVLREECPSLFGPATRGLVTRAEAVHDSWRRPAEVGDENTFDLIGEPLLKGYAFLLAAFGLAEIAYTQPAHEKYRRPNQTYLTPWDGLRYVRLTPLGEFVFRRRDTLEVAVGPAAHSPILLDEVRLLATCRSADPLTELTLGQFFEPLASGRYRMTPKSLLGGCASPEDLAERLRLFRRVVSANPPAIWEEFFVKTLARVAPLSLEPEFLLLKLGPEEDLRRLFATDPVLRQLVLKVEGRRIAVRQDDLKKLAKRLEQFGYLSPLPRG